MKAVIKGHVTAYEDEGTGPAIVLIHGYGLCRGAWRYQQDCLSTSGYRVIVPDLCGFGESPAFQGKYSMSVFADDLIGLLDYLGIGRAVFCGMSMGGYVLFDLLDRYPGRVAGACFAVTKYMADSEPEKARRTVIAGLFHKGSRGVALGDLASSFLYDHTKNRSTFLNDALNWLNSSSSEALAGTLLALRDRKDYTAKIQNYFQPALVIGAEKDNLVPPEQSQSLALALPNAVCRILPGVGHLANMERPALFNACLLEFLDLLRPGVRMAARHG